jgi:hypothetical protein
MTVPGNPASEMTRLEPPPMSSTGSAAASAALTASIRAASVPVRLSDQAYSQRFDIEVLATSPASLAAETAGLKMARETTLKWTHEGWPLHDFLRVYLESRLSASSQ